MGSKINRRKAMDKALDWLISEGISNALVFSLYRRYGIRETNEALAEYREVVVREIEGR
jgi:hypothetical protein